MDGKTRARRAGASRWLAALALLAAAPSGCGNFKGTTATSFMNQVKRNSDPNIRYEAYSRLAAPNCYENEEQKVQAARLLIAGLEEGREPLATRAVICRTLGELRRPEAREALRSAVSDPESIVRAEACRALGKVGGPEDAIRLAGIMKTEIQLDCKIAAIEGLGEMKKVDARVEEALVEVMDRKDPAMHLASLRTLKRLTGQDLGLDPKPWQKFVEARVTRQDALLAERQGKRDAKATQAAGRPSEKTSR